MSLEMQMEMLVDSQDPNVVKTLEHLLALRIFMESADPENQLSDPVLAGSLKERLALGEHQQIVNEYLGEHGLTKIQLVSQFGLKSSSK